MEIGAPNVYWNIHFIQSVWRNSNNTENSHVNSNVDNGHSAAVWRKNK